MSTPPPGHWPPHPPEPPHENPQWGVQPTRQRGSSAGRLILGGLVLLVVVVVTVVATLLITKDDPDQATPPTTSASAPSTTDSSDFVSADDDGPVGIITEDPTCAAWTPIAETLSAQASKGWNDRDPSIPASAWTAEQRAQHEAIAKGMRSAADGSMDLAQLTPHRVVRELYEQATAYWRAYAEAVPTYSPPKDALAQVATSAANAISNICSAIAYGSAASRAPLVSPSPAPYGAGNPQLSEKPTRYVAEVLSVCSEWISAANKLDADTADWFATDPNMPATQWSSEQRAIYERTAPILQASADQMQNLGAQSLNPIFDDFAALSTQYRRAYVQSFPSYVPADAYLVNTAAELTAANSHACRAVGAG